MKIKINFLLLVFCGVCGQGLGQSILGRPNLTLSLIHQRMSGDWQRGYGFQDILGYSQTGFGKAEESSNGIMAAGFYTLSLLNGGGKSKFYIGDYIGLSSGLGAARNSTKFLGETTGKTEMTGLLGFLGGLTIGYSPSSEIDFGLRWYYDFQGWMFYVGEDTDFNFMPFTRNVQLVGRFGHFSGDLTFGGYDTHLNSQRNIRYTTINFRNMVNEKNGLFWGIRLDFFNKKRKVSDDIDARFFALGASLGWWI